MNQELVSLLVVYFMSQLWSKFTVLTLLLIIINNRADIKVTVITVTGALDIHAGRGLESFIRK